MKFRKWFADHVGRLFVSNQRPLTALEKIHELEKLARPLMVYLNDNYHPHHHVVITPIRVELLEGVMATTTYDYVKD
jgi:hypothetical protein